MAENDAAPHALSPERDQLLAEIAEEARATELYTGRAAFTAETMAALARVPRQRFVAPEQEELAYVNGPLPIGYGQTISQPYIVALMTDLLDLRPGQRVLEVGTGSGYQAAVLAELGADIYSIEIVPELAEAAAERLVSLGYRDIHLRRGDGHAGWPEAAPFDRIIVTAGPRLVPMALVEQLAPGGRMVLPVGDRMLGQMLTLIEKDGDGAIREKPLLPVAFVPLTRREER